MGWEGQKRNEEKLNYASRLEHSHQSQKER